MTPSASVTTLFLDIGGVLLTNGWDHHLRTRAADKFGLEIRGIIHTGYETTRKALEAMGLPLGI